MKGADCERWLLNQRCEHRGLRGGEREEERRERREEEKWAFQGRYRCRYFWVEAVDIRYFFYAQRKEKKTARLECFLSCRLESGWKNLLKQQHLNRHETETKSLGKSPD